MVNIEKYLYYPAEIAGFLVCLTPLSQTTMFVSDGNISNSKVTYTELMNQSLMIYEHPKPGTNIKTSVVYKLTIFLALKNQNHIFKLYKLLLKFGGY